MEATFGPPLGHLWVEGGGPLKLFGTLPCTRRRTAVAQAVKKWDKQYVPPYPEEAKRRRDKEARARARQERQRV